MEEQAELILNGDVCQVCGEDFLEDGPGYPRTCSGCAGKDSDDDHDFYKHIRQERRAGLEPGRVKYAMQKLGELKVQSTIAGGGDQIVIEFNGKRIDFWPFTGWYCGRKPIGNIKGRGIENLIKELKKFFPAKPITNIDPKKLTDADRQVLEIFKIGIEAGLEVLKSWNENEGVKCPEQKQKMRAALKQVNDLLKG